MANPVTWFEIIGKDAVGLQKFYKEIFDWKLSPPAPEMGMYSMLENEGHGINGGIGASDEHSPSRVTIYVEVDDPQAYLDKINRAGGKTIVPVTEIPGAGVTFAQFSDPDGHVVGLLKARG
jgi:predicted enzyme related to lactoylglutathione lyase